MELDLTSLKDATDKILKNVKNGIGIVYKSKQNIANKIDELDTYQKQQRTLDSEIEGQLSIMYKIIMQLQTKQEEINFSFEKYSPTHQRLDDALNALKSRTIDESLIQETTESEDTNKGLTNDGEIVKVSGTANVINSGSTASNDDENKKSKEKNEEAKYDIQTRAVQNVETKDKLDTLHDFVDIATITMYRNSFQESLASLTKLKSLIEPLIRKLLASINSRVVDIKKHQDKLVFEYKTVKEKWILSDELWAKAISFFTKLEKDYKRLVSLLSIKQLSQITTKEEEDKIHGYHKEEEEKILIENQQNYIEFPWLVEELEHVDDNIWNYCFNAYMEIYQGKQKSLLDLVSFTPVVQNVIQTISKNWGYFVKEKKEIEGIYLDIEKLTIWYENFRMAYDQFEEEIQVRRDNEIQMNKEVREFTNRINTKYSAEFRRRIKFNEEHAKYLPENLRVLLDEPPIKYEVYPQMLNFSAMKMRKDTDGSANTKSNEKSSSGSGKSQTSLEESLNKSQLDK